MSEQIKLDNGRVIEIPKELKTIGDVQEYPVCEKCVVELEKSLRKRASLQEETLCRECYEELKKLFPNGWKTVSSS